MSNDLREIKITRHGEFTKEARAALKILGPSNLMTFRISALYETDLVLVRISTDNTSTYYGAEIQNKATGTRMGDCHTSFAEALAWAKEKIAEPATA